MANIFINGLNQYTYDLIRYISTNVNDGSSLQICGINDLIGNIPLAIYKIRYDNLYNKRLSTPTIEQVDDSTIQINGLNIPYSSERNITNLPLFNYNQPIVVDSTGISSSSFTFDNYQNAGAGACLYVNSYFSSSTAYPTPIIGNGNLNSITSSTLAYSLGNPRTAAILWLLNSINANLAIKSCNLEFIEPIKNNTTEKSVITTNVPTNSFRIQSSLSSDFYKIGVAEFSSIPITSSIIYCPSYIGSICNITITFGSSNTIDDLILILKNVSESYECSKENLINVDSSRIFIPSILLNSLRTIDNYTFYFSVLYNDRYMYSYSIVKALNAIANII